VSSISPNSRNCNQFSTLWLRGVVDLDRARRIAYILSQAAVTKTES
jgi:hypothetical protein